MKIFKCKNVINIKKLTTIIVALAMIAGLFHFTAVNALAAENYGVNLAGSAYQSSVNPFYAKYGGSSTNGYGGQCTWYVWGRAYEKLGVSLPCRGNANNWTSEAANAGYSTGSVAQANSIMVEHDSSYGHVLFVEKVENGYAYVTEGNYNSCYHEDVINLSTMCRSGWRTSMNTVDYIYLDSSSDQTSDQTPTVSFSPWSNDSYTYIGENDAAIGQEINVSVGTPSLVGMYLFDNNENFLAEGYDTSLGNAHMYYKINSELGYTLLPGTTYKYKFYVVINDVYYWSDKQSIKTTGTAGLSVSFSPWESTRGYTYIGNTDASIGQRIDVSGGTATDMGIYLYDANGNFLASKNEGSYYYLAYYKINSELGYTLSPGTTYQYKFFAVVNGTTYWSSMQSFKTS